MKLDTASLRVLGALMEKEMTTPDVYPLTLNTIVAAANQRSSRDPIMDLTEDQVRSALHLLETEQLVTKARDSGRVSRYEHRIRTVLNLRRDETAVLCVLLLRGAQTVGELRGRTERMHSFDDLLSVQSALDRLAGRETPITAATPRAPGSREIRWIHLLDGTPMDVSSAPIAAPQLPGSSTAPPEQEAGMRDALRAASESVAALEHRVVQLEQRLDRLTATPRE